MGIQSGIDGLPGDGRLPVSLTSNLQYPMFNIQYPMGTERGKTVSPEVAPHPEPPVAPLLLPLLKT